MKRRSIRTPVIAALCAVSLIAVLGPTAAGAHGGGRGDGHGNRYERDHRSDTRNLDRHRYGRHGHRHGDSPWRNGADPVRTITRGLNGPFGLTVDGSTLYVAENDAGRVTQLNLRNGRTRTAVELAGVSSVTTLGDRLVMVTGASAPPEEGDAPPDDGAPPEDAAPVAPVAAAARGPRPAPAQPMSVYVAKPGHRPRLLADLLKYELQRNPDGQLQFDPSGAPVDALSNPFDVLGYGRHAVLVADAGANAVLKVTDRGRVSTFFVPPLVTTGACAGMPNNDPAHAGCDPVPTGLAWGPRGTLYVSTLSAEVPGEGRVYVLDRHGRVLDVIGGFDGPTGVAVGADRTIYVSEVLHNLPADADPTADAFDPSTIGRIVRVGPHGQRSYAAVTMPTGIEVAGGTLFSTAWSIAGSIGMPDAGQVVTVGKRAFTRATAPPPSP